RTASAMAGAAPGAPPSQYAMRPEGAFYRVTRPWSEVGIDETLPILQQAEAAAKSLDPHVSKVTVWLASSDERVLIADLNGGLHVDRRPMTRLWVNTVATKNGGATSNSSNVAGRQGLEWYTDARIQEVAKQAVDRTMVLFDARRPPAGELPVVLAAGASGILLHEAIGHGMEADYNRKRVSIYADMLGKEVAAPFVTIVDDGTLEGERGALNVDDEGEPAGRTVLVDRGVLVGYMHDAISARSYG